MTEICNMVLENGRVIDNICNIQTKVNKFNYLCSIENFSLRSEENGDKIVSSPFIIGKKDKSEWCLWVYPHGDDEETQDYVSVYLMLNKSSKTEAKAKYRFFILNDKNEEGYVIEQQDIRNFIEGEGWGLSQFIKRDFLLNNDNGLLVNDKLTILCEILVFYESENSYFSGIPVNVKIPESRLSLDFNDMLNSSLFSDCIIKVKNIDLKVHKGVLATRSPVFCDIFNGTIKKSQINVVEINNFSIEVVREMLRYIYTDEVLNVQSMAGEMLAIADEYKLDRLKSISEYTLCNNLNTENVCEYFLLSETSSAKELKEYCQEFIIKNVEDLIKTNSWKTFILQNPLLLESLFLKLLNIPNSI